MISFCVVYCYRLWNRKDVFDLYKEEAYRLCYAISKNMGRRVMPKQYIRLINMQEGFGSVQVVLSDELISF